MRLLSVKNLTFGYEDSPVLEDFNFYINENEIVLIEGKNGSGKTTLLKCITNMLNNGKNIVIREKEVSHNKQLLREISFIMSDDILYDYLTVKENINFFRMLFNEDNDFLIQINQLCADFCIEKYNDYLIKNLSQGTRNKVYLAIMLSKKHKILILDEPFTALDKETQKIVIGKIENYRTSKDKSVIMVTHIDEFKNLATRIENIEKIEN